MIKEKTIALIAHDRRKQDMVNWVEHNATTLINNKLVCTGTTGKLIQNILETIIGDEEWGEEHPNPLNLIKKKSGPLGGDAQIATMVVEGEIDLCVFLIDDLNSNPHEADIQMLLRQCRIHNIPVACNRHSADLMITSNLWGTKYKPTDPIYKDFNRR
jgi:methylglyoxal synthase